MPEKVQKGPNNFRHFLLLLSVFTLNSKKNLLMSFFSSGLAPLSPPNTVLLRRGLLVLNELKNIWKCQQIYFANLYFGTMFFWNIYFWNIYFGDICFGKEKTRRIYIKFLKHWWLPLEQVEALIFSCKSLNFLKLVVDIYVKGKVPGKTSISRLGKD